MTSAPATDGLPRASLRESLGVATNLLVPLVARGLIARRPRVLALADRIDADRRAVRRMQRLAERHSPGPLVLRLPVRTLALVLDPSHVRRILDGSPEPFATASVEKRFALGHFQPQGSLISDARERSLRRPFNGEVLDEDQPLHRLSMRFTEVIREEAADLVAQAEQSGQLDWDRFIVVWWRVVRRVVLGDAARDDEELTGLLTRLRSDANWSYLRPRRDRLRRRFDSRLRFHLDRAEPGSLAELVAAVPAPPGTVPHQQVPQWLFAFDPAGMSCLRALALLAAHPVINARVRQELTGSDPAIPHERPLLRACVLESLRLWPTTPAVLRDSTRETSWPDGTLPTGAGLAIYAPLFHRDDRFLDYANRFAPEVWLVGEERQRWPLIPFSSGPAACPGRNLVLMTTSTMLAVLVSSLRLRLIPEAKLDPARPLPGTLSPFRLRFAVLPHRT